MGRSDYWTMKEIGVVFGVTSHVVGKTLKRLSLRTPEGKPSRLAFDLGLVEQRWSLDAYTWVWNQEKTCPLLEQAGLERITMPDRLDEHVAPAKLEDVSR